jgi:hypothetical protein
MYDAKTRSKRLIEEVEVMDLTALKRQEQSALGHTLARGDHGWTQVDPGHAATWRKRCR